MSTWDNKAISGKDLQEKVLKDIASKIKALQDFGSTDEANVIASALVDLSCRVVGLEERSDIVTLADIQKYCKQVQAAKSSPSSSGTTISFIDTITQDENGDITATKKTVRSGTTSQTGIVQLEDSHTSTSTSTAATPKNVKEAYDLASGKADPASVVDSATYNSSNHTIIFKHGSTQLFTLDAAAFVKDGMVDSVAISNGNLVITFNTDAGKQPISIPLTDIFNPNNYYTKTATDTLLGGKSPTTHAHSVSINGSTKTIAASGGTAVDLGTYKVFNYAKVFTSQTYDASSTRYIRLAYRITTYTNNWEESSMFKLVVHDGQVPKELVFRLWLKGDVSTDVVPADPSDPKLYRVYSENFSESELDILDVRLFVIEKSAGSIEFTIGIFIDRNYLQTRWVSYQLYPLSCGTRGLGNTIDNGLSSWTYNVGQDVYEENLIHDDVFTTLFEVNDLTVDMTVKKAISASNGVFYATYGVTTFIEMKVALMEGNVVILRHDGQSILCQSWSDTVIYFAGITCSEDREPPTLLRFWCYVNTGWTSYPSADGVCVPISNTTMKTVEPQDPISEWLQVGNLMIGGHGVPGGGIDINAKAVNSALSLRMDEVIYTTAPGINNGAPIFVDKSFSTSSWALLFQLSQVIGAGQYSAKVEVNLYTKENVPEHYHIVFHFNSEDSTQKVYISAQCDKGTEV